MSEIVINMIKMFADDTKIFAECKNNEDRIRLQEDLEISGVEHARYNSMQKM